MNANMGDDTIPQQYFEYINATITVCVYNGKFIMGCTDKIMELMISTDGYFDYIMDDIMNTNGKIDNPIVKNVISMIDSNIDKINNMMKDRVK